MVNTTDIRIAHTAIDPQQIALASFVPGSNATHVVVRLSRTDLRDVPSDFLCGNIELMRSGAVLDTLSQPSANGGLGTFCQYSSKFVP